MKTSDNAHRLRRLLILSATLCALAALPFLSSARSTTANPATSVNIVNNSSSRQIRMVYLSHVNADDWTGNQLSDTTIDPGQSYMMGNVACDQQQVKVIGEDQDGCFVSTVVSCGASATWTITNDTAADCGQ